MDLPGESVFFLGGDSEDFLLARDAVAGVVANEEHAEAALEGRMPGHFGRVRSEQGLAHGRGALV
jgi:hypothetical protein